MMSFWVVPESCDAATPLRSARGDVEREQPRRGGVDRHRGVHAVERDAREQRLHVVDVPDRHAHLADLAARERVVGVEAGLGGQIERHREAGLALGEVAAVELVARARGRVAGVGAEHPGPVAGVGGRGHKCPNKLT